MTDLIGLFDNVWNQFGTSGVLNKTADLKFNQTTAELPICAFAHDLGTVNMKKTTPVVYAIGYVRDPLVQFSNVPNIKNVRSPYFRTRHGPGPDVLELVRWLCISYMAMLI